MITLCVTVFFVIILTLLIMSVVEIRRLDYDITLYRKKVCNLELEVARLKKFSGVPPYDLVVLRGKEKINEPHPFYKD